MNQQKVGKFCVMELIEPSEIDSEKYVCVPNSWIRLQETEDGLVVVKFPIGKLSEIKKLVQKEEKFSDEWMIVVADLKYHTNSYKDANDYIKILVKISIQEDSYMEILGKGTPSTSAIKMLEPLVSSETNEVGMALAQLNIHTEQTSNPTTSQQMEFTNHEINIHREKIKILQTSNSTTEPKRHMTRQSVKMCPSAKTVSSLDQAAKKSKKTSSSAEENGEAEHIQENVSSSVENTPELTSKAVIVVALKSVLGNNFKEKLNHLYSEHEKNHIMFENIRQAFVKNCTVLKELIQLTNQITDSEIAAIELGNVMVREDSNQNCTVYNEAQREEDNIIDSDEATEIKNDNPLNKIRGRLSKFTLPPEYDPEDSKWTLKYRTKGKGLVELTPHSGIFVDANNLNTCKTISKDSKTLARMLLMEIFRESALSTCSLTGKKPNAFDIEGTRVRPGLDEHARTVLLNYVEQHAVDHNWTKVDSQTIVSTLRNKIQDMRAKYMYDKSPKR